MKLLHALKRFSRQQTSGRRNQRGRARLALEALESRVTPSVTLNTTGQLIVRGDGAGDVISIGTSAAGGVFVDFNGATSTFGPGQVSSIEVFTSSAGGAKVTVLSTPASVPLTITTHFFRGVVENQVILGGGNLDNLQGPVTVFGNDSPILSFDDHASPADRNYTIENDPNGSGGLLIGDGRVGFHDAALSPPIIIDGGTGKDTFDVMPTSQSLANLNAFSLAFNGGGGSDSLTVNDQNDPVSRNYHVNSGLIGGGFSTLLPIGYSGIQSVTLNGSNASGPGQANVFGVFSIPNRTAVTFNTGSGVNDVVVSGGGAIQGALTVSGAPTGFTTVTLDDTANAAGRGFTVSNNQVSIGLGPIDFSGIQSLVLDGGSGTNHFLVVSTPVGLVTTINTGPKGDTIQAGGFLGGNVGALQGPLIINGLPDSHTTFTVSDHNTFTPETYTPAATPTGGEVLTRSGGLVATCNTVANLIVDGGIDGDQFVEVDPATRPVTFNAGSGFGLNSLSATEGFGHITNWLITGPGSGRVDNLLTFSGMDDLVGSNNFNDFKFFQGGSIDGSIAGSGGPGNILSYANETGPVTVNLQTGAASQIAGGAPGGFRGITEVDGSTSANDTLIGPDANTTWTVSAANGGSGVAGSFAFLFSGFQNLVGGAGMNVFQFTAGGSLAGSLNGGAAPLHEGNWLDYFALATPVAVNLQTGAATGVAGGVSNIQNVHGGNGGNTLTGDSQGNILIGGSGSDRITGGSGASLLIGDAGADTLSGGSGGDILIGDATSFDTMTPSNEQALMAILAEWQSADSYATRFFDINTGSGGGLNGTAKLNFGTTVIDDGAADTVTAAATSAALDWFFRGTGDVLRNVEPGEHINNNTPAAFKDRTVTSPIPEGGLATVSGTITDPDPHDAFTLVVNWGDGTPAQTYTFPPGSNGLRVSVSHQYRDEGRYTVALSWTDPTGPANHATLAVSVFEVAPVVQAGGDVGLEQGGVLQRFGLVSGPEVDSYTAAVDYGDGTVPQPLPVAPHFLLQHQYRHPGRYHVAVTVTDDDGTTGTDFFTVTVI
jgi:hypothetical protein